MIGRHSSLTTTVWTATACLAAAFLGVAALVIARFGQWAYPTVGGRAALCGLFAAASALAGVAGGTVLWLFVNATGAATGLVTRRWLAAAAALCAGSGTWAMLTRKPFTVLTSPAWLALLAGGFLFVVAATTNRRAWSAASTFVVVASGLLLAALICWLNFAFIRKADTVLSGVLNAGALVLAYGLAGCGLAVLSHRAASAPKRTRCKLPPAESPPDPASLPSRLALGGLVLVAACTIMPLYRMAATAGVTQPRAEARTADDTPPAELARLTAVSPQARQVRNVILISIDTLRADHLGVYGYPVPTSPNIDSFFSTATVFTHAYSQAPWTLPSHMSMITGQYPSTHGVRVHPTATPGYADRLPDTAVTLAELLRDRGMATGAFTGGLLVGREYGFDQGFDVFGEARSRRMKEVLDMALPWLRTHAGEPFFLFLHSYDVHCYNPSHRYSGIADDSYRGPLRAIRSKRPSTMEWYVVADGFYSLSAADVRFLESLYDSEIREVDAQLGRLFGQLDSLGLLDRTAIVMTSDHGENFYEHRTTGHAFNLYSPVLHIPLLVRTPSDHRRRTITTRVQTIDIAPTVLDLLGYYPEASRTMQGDPLTPALLGRPLADRPILVEADALDTQAALYLGRYKYIHYGVLSHSLLDAKFILLSLRGLLSPYAKGEELFELRADPGEKANLASAEPQRTAELRRTLFRTIHRLRRFGGGSRSRSPAPLTPRMKNGLRSLGYLE